MSAGFARNTNILFGQDPIRSLIVQPSVGTTHTISITFSNPETAAALLFNNPLDRLSLRGSHISCQLSDAALRPFLEAVAELCPNSDRIQRMLDAYQQPKQISQHRSPIAAL